MTETLRPASAAPARERLLDAMVRVVARSGYADASVARVVRLAGTSRAVFYEHFSNREDCFLAAQQTVAERALRCLGADGAARVGVPAALEDALVRAAENPAAARFLLVETAGANRVARVRHEAFLGRVKELIDRSLAPPHLPQLTTASLLDGAAGVIAIRLLRGEGDALPGLAPGLLAWGSAYVLPGGGHRLSQEEWSALGRSQVPAEPARGPDLALLPRGRSALDPAASAASRRRRIVVATAQAAVRKGFAAMTVADIVAAARVPRSAFYSQFPGKQGAFLAVQEDVLGEAMAAAAARFARGGSWPERVWNGLEGLLYYVAERPDLALAGFVEVQSAGTAALLRSYESCLAFTLFLEEGVRERGGSRFDSRVGPEAIAFAIQGVVRRALLSGGAGRLPELLPQCSHLALAPFLGSRRSLQFVSARARAAR